MAIIPHRELRNDSSRVLRAVQAGQTFEVTNHGDVVAILSPPRAADGQLRFRAATTRGGFAALLRVELGFALSTILDELRGDR